jgi:hypothetical protein
MGTVRASVLPIVRTNQSQQDLGGECQSFHGRGLDEGLPNEKQNTTLWIILMTHKRNAQEVRSLCSI